MRGVSESLPSNACGILFLPVCLAALCLVPILAQKAPETGPPKYDLRTETKIKGSVQDVKLPPKGSEKEIAHVLLKMAPKPLTCICVQSPSSTIWA